MQDLYLRFYCLTNGCRNTLHLNSTMNLLWTQCIFSWKTQVLKTVYFLNGKTHSVWCYLCITCRVKTILNLGRSLFFHVSLEFAYFYSFYTISGKLSSMNDLNFIGRVKRLYDLVVNYESPTLKAIPQETSRNLFLNFSNILSHLYFHYILLRILFSTRSYYYTSLVYLISLSFVSECFNRKIARSAWMVIVIQQCKSLGCNHAKIFLDILIGCCQMCTHLALLGLINMRSGISFFTLKYTI